MATTTTTAFSMKLLIDTKARRVVFAEARKAVVDYLHNLLVSHEESIGLENATMAGCIDNLDDSFDDLDIAAGRIELSLLGPPPSPEPPTKKRFFQCSDKRGGSCDGYVTDARGARCPSCGWEMAAEVPCGSPGAGCSGQSAAAGGADGPVQGADVRCLLNDDLTVTPVSIEALRNRAGLLKEMGVDEDEVEEMTVPVGYTQALAILGAALRSSTVLTDVFLGNKAPDDA